MARNLTILYLEDNPDDELLFRRYLAKNSFSGKLLVVNSVSEGMDYIRGDGKYSDRTDFPLPHLIVCDYHMPRATGLEFIKWFRAAPEQSGVIPVFLFTSSLLLSRLSPAEHGAATRCFTKPDSADGWQQTVNDMLAATGGH